MSILREWISRLRDTFRPRRSDTDLQEELRLHMELAAEESQRRGASDGRIIRATLGSPASAMEALRDQRGVPWVADLSRDVRYAWRGFVRSPGFSIVAVLTLALGTGANTAIFSLINTLMLRPLPVRAPHELVEFLSVYPDPSEPRHNMWSREFYDLARQHDRVFAAVAGVAPARFRTTRDGVQREEVSGAFVTGSFFPLLGLDPVIGRLIGPADDRAGAPPPDVVVIGETYWQSRFNRNATIVGQQITINGVGKTIVGVAPRAFAGLQAGFDSRIWMPADRSTPLSLFGRLRDGVSPEQARAALVPLNRQRVEEIATRSKDPRWLETTLELESARAGGSALRDRYSTPLIVLMAVVGVLLAIASINLAGLMLARGAARGREMAVRLSLGAGRGRLVRQLLTESLLLSSAGSALGVVVAYLAVGAMLGVLLGSLPHGAAYSGMTIDVQPDLRVLLFTIGIAVVTGMVFGLAPAWQAVSSAPVPTLREIRGSESRSRRLFGKGLVVAQVALSAALLSSAGLFVRHLSNLRTDDLGFRRDSVLLVTLEPAGSGYDPGQLSRSYRDLLARLEGIPGVRSATLSAVTPIGKGAASRFVSVEGFDEPPEARRRVLLNWVAPRYFETFGTALIAGRDFRFDQAQGSRVAIVNQSMARYYFGDGRVIGRRVTLERETRPYEIIGIVEDAKYSDLRLPAPRTMYFNAFAGGEVRSKFALHTTIDPAAVAGPVRHAVRETVPGVEIAEVTTLADQMDSSIVVERVLAGLAGWFGALGVLLAAIGIYGLLAYSVARRTNEIGIRMALGATASNVTLMVLKSALGLVLTGLAIAVPIAFWSERAAVSMVENLPPSTVLPAAFVALSMIGLALIAACLPARRAAGVAPADALRHE